MSRVWSLALTLHASLATAAGVEVVKTLPGFSGPNPSSAGTSSADMMGGVSPRHLVGFINGAFEVRRKSDGGLVQPPLTQREFWTAAFRSVGRTMEGNPYDPRIFWDPLTKRWFASSNSMDLEAGPGGSRMSSRIFFAVSQDDDPTHPWKAVMHACPMAVDNAKLGLDRNGVYSTALTGGPGDTRAVVPIIAIPKVDLLWKGDGAPSLEHANTFTVDGGSRLSDRKYAGVEGMVPAFDLDPKKKPGDPAVYVNRYRKEVDGETILQIRRVSWTSPTKAVHYRKDMDLTKPSNTSWSDYSTVVVDPSDPTLFWTYQEATTNETWPPDKADRFGTHWVAWRVGAAK